MTKRTFFKRRESKEIANLDEVYILDAQGRRIREDGKILDTHDKVLSPTDQREYQGRGLTEALLYVAADPEHRALQIGNPNYSVSLTPENVARGRTVDTELSRKFYKHGWFAPLRQPKTKQGVLESRVGPLGWRIATFEEFDKRPRGKREGETIPAHELFCVGYSYWPVQGTKQQVRVPFDVLTDALRIVKYTSMAENEEAKPEWWGTKTLPNPMDFRVYDDPTKVARERIAKEGAVVAFTTPSRTKGKRPRYEGMITNLAVLDGQERNIVGLSTQPRWTAEGPIPGDEHWRFGYQFATTRTRSDNVTWGSHSAAAAYALQQELFKERGTLVPFQTSPLANPSEILTLLDGMINNNVIIYDPEIKAKDKRRRLRRAEKCKLLGEVISEIGHKNTLFWDPFTDKKLTEQPIDMPTQQNTPQTKTIKKAKEILRKR